MIGRISQKLLFIGAYCFLLNRFLRKNYIIYVTAFSLRLSTDYTNKYIQ